MKDFPCFATDHGVASLILREIPYRQEAYIRIQDAVPEELTALLEECVSFCRMAGAERIYVRDYPGLPGLPLHCAVYEMRGQAWVDPEKLESLFPVTEVTAGRWRQIHNERMRGVDCAATKTSGDEKELVESGGAYFVHRNGELLGIGWLHDTQLSLVCSAGHGTGERVMHTLMSLVEGAQMSLQVASTNERAIRLYEKLGFVKTAEVASWFDASGLRPGRDIDGKEKL